MKDYRKLTGTRIYYKSNKDDQSSMTSLRVSKERIPEKLQTENFVNIINMDKPSTFLDSKPMQSEWRETSRLYPQNSIMKPFGENKNELGNVVVNQSL